MRVVWTRAMLEAVIAIVLHAYTIAAITLGITLPDWWIPLLAGVVALYFSDRTARPEETLVVKPLVIRTIIVLSALVATVCWLSYTITIPEFWVAYLMAVVGFYIPVAARPPT